jgi:hypothetical protein
MRLPQYQWILEYRTQTDGVHGRYDEAPRVIDKEVDEP